MFYKLELNYDKQSRGTEGIQCLPDRRGHNIDELYNFLIYKNEKYSNIGKQIPFDFELGVILKPKAILTDFLLLGHLRTSFGLLLSESAYSIIKKHKIPPYQKYEVKIKNNESKYYWIYFFRLVECIDFSKTYYVNNGKFRYHDESTFIDVRKSYDIKLRQIEKEFPFNNPEKQNAIIDLDNSTDAKKNHLKDNWNSISYDLACFKYDTNIFISDSLRNELIESSLTGFEIEAIHENDTKIHLTDLQSV